MRENRQGDARAVVQAGMCTALAVILSMIGLYTPLFSIVTFMLIPLPIAYLGLRQGVRWSVIVTAGVMVLDSVFFGYCVSGFNLRHVQLSRRGAGSLLSVPCVSS